MIDSLWVVAGSEVEAEDKVVNPGEENIHQLKLQSIGEVSDSIANLI